MSKKKEVVFENIVLGKLVHGGQCLAETPNGKKLFVWGGLPGEAVDVRITKKKSGYREGVVTEVHKASKDRVEPLEPLSYLSTSPWQIMSLKAENSAKQSILEETFQREGVKGISWSKFEFTAEEFAYRNKQEFGFWGNEKGLHLAHFIRGSHGKQIVDKSELAKECINEAAREIRDELNKLEIWGGKLKTLVLRCNQQNEVAGALFIKEELDLSQLSLPKSLKGVEIYYSDPKSPASLPTKKIYSFGDIKLSDRINGINIIYDVMSFFQVNIPVFELALSEIKKQLKGENIVDMYSGVGTIGIVVGANKLVESDENNINMAIENIKGKKIEVIQASSEAVTEEITSEATLILDPPRAGLHKKVTERILETKPPQIAYLSCNPSTQARDIKLLEHYYNISFAQGYNFFPRTPHIESLIVLELK